MKIVQGHMVPLGYGKFFRSDSIDGLEPVEAGRNPGKRTTMYVEHLPMPVVAPCCTRSSAIKATGTWIDSWSGSVKV
jgi:hypothetical protein